jgi:hypothetical protein
MTSKAQRRDIRRDIQRLAVVAAFFRAGSAASVAALCSTRHRKLHAGDVQRIWNEAKAKGDLPKLRRPAGGPRAVDAGNDVGA